MDLHQIIEALMKKVLFILCFVSMIFAQQDTLITKQGKIYNDFHFNRAGNKILSIKILDQLKQKL